MPNKSALIVIDVQRVMFETPGEFAFNGEAVLETIAGLIARARNSGVPVIYVQHDAGEDSSMPRGSELWQIHPAIAPQEGEIVVEKRKPDAFAGTEFKSVLDGLGVSRLVLCGLQTDCCVDTTCRRASSEGYEVILAADAHSTFDCELLTAEQLVAYHNWSLGKRFAAVLASAEIRF
ncbi:MAG: cysteine hydrolase [Proteobacteria bacterium]|nr:cysteine hydrolase [Pseudomonadota bacterium]